jgi:hypothetical protein
MSELGAGLPQSAIGSVINAAAGSAAADALRLAAAGPAGKLRPVIVMLGSPFVAQGEARSEGAAAAATLAALAQDFALSQPGSLRDASEQSPIAVEAGFVMLWQAAGDPEDAAILQALDKAGGRVHFAGLSGVEAELARISPGSRAAFVVLAPDQTILSTHPLERMSPDPEQQLAELTMALLDAAYAEGLPKEGP